MTDWDPAQYLRFAGPRLRPAVDLLSRIELDEPARIYDLGCGSGSVTRLIAAHWPKARVTGVDSSPQMLALADASGLPNLGWLQHDLVDWQAESPAHLIYSNAALHWLPDHRQLFPRLLSQLAPRGVLAVQMPRNFPAPSHAAIADTVRAGPWRGRLEPLLRESPVASPHWYLDLLTGAGAVVDLWETEYFSVLEGEDPVLQWTRGTWLAPLLAVLPEEERTSFERAYAERVAEAYPRRTDGSTVLPFRRLFFVARLRA